MIEATHEDVAGKQALFQKVGLALKRKGVPADEVLLCSTTEPLAVDMIASKMEPEYRNRCIGLHFSKPDTVDNLRITYVDNLQVFTLYGCVARMLKVLKFAQYDPNTLIVVLEVERAEVGVVWSEDRTTRNEDVDESNEPTGEYA